MIVHAETRVTLLGGGDLPEGDLAWALERAPVLVAADGGADAALASGLIPDAVIGDLDSLSEDALDRLPAGIIHRIAEQDSTDFDKALRSIDAPGVIAVGFTGRRIDHELAAYHTIATRRPPPCIVLGGKDIAFHAPDGGVAIELPPGSRVSLFPLAPVTVWATGLRWPVEALALDPLARIGTSNEVTDGPVTIRADGPGLLVILPRDALDAAAEALF
ncbi:thiamine diphosphokinase [Rhodobacterales bacterium HKCCE3408]|nr:thiamine diphosphokinase [Rhodobacterales bacterium HKCCE3408]